MVQTDQKLDEIVVVAYGTRKKSDLTGAVTQVSAKDFQKGNIASSEQLLQGKVAGLEVTTLVVVLQVAAVKYVSARVHH